MNQIQKGDHVFICGSTGTGKSFLAKLYTSKLKDVYVLDNKGTFTFTPFLHSDKVKIYTDFKDLQKHKDDDITHVIYRPNIYENNSEFYEQFLEMCYNKGNCNVLIDEAMAICTSSNIPFWYKSLLTKGRELKISVWSCSQRPAQLSNFVLTESKHWFIFRLNAVNDRKKIVDCSGNDSFAIKITGHYFLYKNMDTLRKPTKSIIKFKRS